jgi:hypothetical protein
MCLTLLCVRIRSYTGNNPHVQRVFMYQDLLYNPGWLYTICGGYASSKYITMSVPTVNR